MVREKQRLAAVAPLAAIFITGKHSAEKARTDKAKVAQPPLPDECNSGADGKRLR